MCVCAADFTHAYTDKQKWSKSFRLPASWMEVYYIAANRYLRCFLFLTPTPEFSFFDPSEPQCREVLLDPSTTIPELFAVLRQWVPQVQKNINHIGNEVTKSSVFHCPCTSIVFVMPLYKTVLPVLRVKNHRFKKNWLNYLMPVQRMVTENTRVRLFLVVDRGPAFLSLNNLPSGLLRVAALQLIAQRGSCLEGKSTWFFSLT